VARATGATVTLLRVVPPGDRELMDLAHGNLGRIASELATSNVNVTVAVRQGDAAREILALVAETSADLIAGKSGRRR
jgi:nucleotide-binding universal stress UspA family protein